MAKPMSGFTERQQRLINTCLKTGYGWAKYARSVQNQGWCTPKQEETLVSMHQRITRGPVRSRRHDAAYDCDISDNEAMSLGEYF